MTSLVFLLFTEEWGFEAQAYTSARYAGQARETLEKLNPYKSHHIQILRLTRTDTGEFVVTNADED